MITLNVKDYCQNCGDFSPETEKLWIGGKVMTSIHCEYREICERIYNSIKRMAGGEKKNG